MKAGVSTISPFFLSSLFQGGIVSERIVAANNITGCPATGKYQRNCENLGSNQGNFCGEKKKRNNGSRRMEEKSHVNRDKSQPTLITKPTSPKVTKKILKLPRPITRMHVLWHHMISCREYYLGLDESTIGNPKLLSTHVVTPILSA